MDLSLFITFLLWTGQARGEIHYLNDHNIPGSTCTSSCPEEWEEDGEHCYYWNSQYLAWSPAEEFCNDRGGHLAAVTTHETTVFLLKLTKTKTTSEKFWIGGTDKATEGTWTWTDGSPMNYTNWAAGKPSETDKFWRQQDCLAVYFADGTWSDKVCEPRFNTKQSVCSRHLCPG